MRSEPATNGRPSGRAAAGGWAGRRRRDALLGAVTIAVVIGVIIVVRDRSEIVARRFVSCLHGHGWTQLTRPNRSLDMRAGRLATSWSQLASSSEPGYAVITAYNGDNFTLIAVGGNRMPQTRQPLLPEPVQPDPPQSLAH